VNDITVLKFGGSTLRGPRDLVRAVHAIYAEVRRGRRVVAVTSAFHGRTDALEESLRLLDAERGRPSSRRTRAALLATGEAETVHLLRTALDRSGVPATSAEVRDVGPFVAPDGEDVTRVDADAIRALLREHDVVCLPGFVAAEDTPERAPALLGRGGSDLTAVEVGAALGAHVVLVKDVEGLYTEDPAAPRPAGAPAPARLRAIDFEGARALGGDVLQIRAIDAAERLRCGLDVVGPGHVAGARGTRVGAPRALARREPAPPPPLRVALLGLGHVGRRVFDELSASPERFVVTGVLVSTLERPEARPHAARPLLTDDVDEVLAGRPDVVIELLAGAEPAAAHVERALAAGCHVVTANKAALAGNAARLDDVARRSGVLLRARAAVGGALPALEAVRRARRDARDPLASIEGVLNGTTNAILERLERGEAFADALAAAQAEGLAEADPAADLDGSDVARKLDLLAHAAGWGEPVHLRRDGIEVLAREGAPCAGGTWKLVGALRRDAAGEVTSEVAPRLLPRDAALAWPTGAWSVLVLGFRSGRTEVLRGRGAGPWPTATAVVGDVLEIARRIALTRGPAAALRSDEGEDRP